MGRVTIVITHVRGLVTPVIATHEPPSTIGAFIVTLREYLYCTNP